MTLNTRIALSVASLGIAFAGMVGSVGIASADQINEDQVGWSCVDDGNRICGPGNDEGKPAGQYDEGGVLVTPWAQLTALHPTCWSVDWVRINCPVDDEPDSFN